MSNIVELFGNATDRHDLVWADVVRDQHCVYSNRRCYKVRKSDPGTSIGTCTVLYGRPPEPVIICPTRLIERGQIFTDCLHLLTTHEPGNELHLVSEVSVPGGSVDYFLVSTRDSRVRDFVGIELQTLDTTGTVWPERQRLLRDLNVIRDNGAEDSGNVYGMNWKMTAKTILVQMHHKVRTFEHVHKRLVLVIQDRLLSYMTREFRFDHLRSPAMIGDSMHLHAYNMSGRTPSGMRLSMAARLSTDADGIGICLGLQAEPRVELQVIMSALEAKISAATIFRPV